MSRETIHEALAEHLALAQRVSAEMVDGIERLAALLVETLRGGGKVLLCGNGGSAADAQHIASELVVRYEADRDALGAISLTTDSSVLTAGGNDLGFPRVFERQVRALGRPGDLLLLLSTSGDSENLLLAADAARDVGMETAALLARAGGALKERVGLALVVPTESTPRAQEMHITIGHVVCELVERAFAEPTA